MSGRVFVKAYQTRKEALGSARAKAGALPQFVQEKKQAPMVPALYE